MAEPILSLFGMALFNAAKKILLAGVEEKLKRRHTLKQRKTAFASAMKAARKNTISQSYNPEYTQKILHVLDGKFDKKRATEFAEESTKLWRLSEKPDREKVIEACRRTLAFQKFITGSGLPSVETIADVMSVFLENLRTCVLVQVSRLNSLRLPRALSL